MTWTLCTLEFDKQANCLKDFIISDRINLFDSIAALEMLDEKMDYYTALQSKPVAVPNEDNAISLFLHFLCGQSWTTCYYPHPNLIKVAIENFWTFRGRRNHFSWLSSYLPIRGIVEPSQIGCNHIRYLQNAIFKKFLQFLNMV